MDFSTWVSLSAVKLKKLTMMMMMMMMIIIRVIVRGMWRYLSRPKRVTKYYGKYQLTVNLFSTRWG